MSGLRVLIVGGYGAFGGRLVDLLVDDPRLTLIIAGRDRGHAVHSCGRHVNCKALLKPARFDRERDVTAQLAMLKPDIVVDASGPFQAYGKGRYRLIEACIAAGINYIDLADATAFVEGVGKLDSAAREAGVYALSGASTCPVLTAAATRRLTNGMTRIDAIRAGIAPSPFANVGESVIRAIASYAGKELRIRRDGVTVAAFPFTEQMRFTIAPPGATALESRLFSLVDVPDLQVLPRLWPDVKTVWVGAAPVPGLLHRMLIGLAWIVRWRLLPSLTPLAKLMHFATNHLHWGAHRGGMFVEVEGADSKGVAIKRSWNLVADGDDGPLIPSMAAAALIQGQLAGRMPAAGARAATQDLELSDYEALFATREIETGVHEEILAAPVKRDAPAPAPVRAEETHAPVALVETQPDAPLYKRLLGPAYEQLPRAIRAMHDRVQRAEGRANVERGGNPLAQLAGWMMEFPRTGFDVPVQVQFTAANGVETWRRTFADQSFASKQYAAKGAGIEPLLCERFGAFAFVMALVRDGDRLRLVPRRWTAFGVPMPLWLGPRCDAYEAEENGAFRFHVEIGHPLCGLIVRYRGLLRPIENARAVAA